MSVRRFESVEFVYFAIPASVVLIVSAIQALGALIVSPERRPLYWRIVWLVHLPFLAGLGALLDPSAGLLLLVAGCVAGVIASGILVRRTGWARGGPLGLFYTLANSYTALFLMMIVRAAVFGEGYVD